MADRLRVHVVVEHPRMRSFVVDLLDREYSCRVISEDGDFQSTAEQFRHGDLLLIDQWMFATGQWRDAVASAGVRVVVVGPEDDLATREAATELGADAWLAREQLGDQLGREILRALEPRPHRTTEGVT